MRKWIRMQLFMLAGHCGNGGFKVVKRMGSQVVCLLRKIDLVSRAVNDPCWQSRKHDMECLATNAPCWQSLNHDRCSSWVSAMGLDTQKATT